LCFTISPTPEENSRSHHIEAVSSTDLSRRPDAHESLEATFDERVALAKPHKFFTLALRVRLWIHVTCCTSPQFLLAAILDIDALVNDSVVPVIQTLKFARVAWTPVHVLLVGVEHPS